MVLNVLILISRRRLFHVQPRCRRSFDTGTGMITINIYVSWATTSCRRMILEKYFVSGDRKEEEPKYFVQMCKLRSSSGMSQMGLVQQVSRERKRRNVCWLSLSVQPKKTCVAQFLVYWRKIETSPCVDTRRFISYSRHRNLGQNETANTCVESTNSQENWLTDVTWTRQQRPGLPWLTLTCHAST